MGKTLLDLTWGQSNLKSCFTEYSNKTAHLPVPNIFLFAPLLFPLPLSPHIASSAQINTDVGLHSGTDIVLRDGWHLFWLSSFPLLQICSGDPKSCLPCPFWNFDLLIHHPCTKFCHLFSLNSQIPNWIPVGLATHGFPKGSALCWAPVPAWVLMPPPPLQQVSFIGMDKKWIFSFLYLLNVSVWVMLGWSGGS